MTEPQRHDEAEAAVLGSMLRDNGCIADILPLVGADDLRTDAHQRVFRAIVDLYQQNQPVDLVTTADWLIAKGWLADVTYPKLGELHDAAPTAANAVYYAKIIRERSLLKHLALFAQEVQTAVQERRASASDLLEEFQGKLLGLASVGMEGQAVLLREAIHEAFERIDARHQRGTGKAGLPTGLVELDELTGGLHPGELIILAARTSIGKTSLALSIARHVSAVEGHPALFVSLEMSKAELAERLMCAEGMVDGKLSRAGQLKDEDFQRLAEAGQRLDPAPLYVDDVSGQSMLHIVATARRLKLRGGLKLVVVDYLQLIRPENRKDPRHEQVAGIARRLKELAKELQAPVLALSQLNRALEDRQDRRPRLSDLRESGEIEQSADVALLLHRPPEKDESTIEVNVAKQRAGPTGIVSLTFERAYTRFTDWVPVPTP